MKRVAIGLHFYQPPVQDLAITKQALDTAYMPILRLLEETPKVGVTVNISACLLQQLAKLQKEEFFVLVRRLVSAGKIELLSGPAYHPVVPMIHREIFERQLDKANKIFTDILGVVPGKGIFLPELAVTPDVMEWVSQLGYDYTIIDKLSAGEATGGVDYGGVRCLLNNRQLSDLIRAYPERLDAAKLAKWIKDQPMHDLVAMNDVEAYGHHYQERGEVLKNLFADEELEFVKMSELNMKFPKGIIKPASWQDVDWNEAKRGPFWTWDNPENPLQQAYKALADLAAEALGLGQEATTGSEWESAAEHLDMGLSSCYLYWLSNWPWWHPDLVERGAQQLIKCIRTVTIDPQIKRIGEERYHNFLGELWQYHWSGQVEEHFKAFEKEREVLLARLPVLD